MLTKFFTYYLFIQYFIIGLFYFPFFCIKYIGFLKQEFQEKLSELFILQVLKIYKWSFGIINSILFFTILSPLILCGGIYILFQLLINYKTIKSLKLSK